MNAKNVAGAAATAPATELEKGCQSSVSAPILPKIPADVKMLREFIRRHIPMMDLLEVVKTLYPRCDKSLLSKCAHGDETGVKLRDDALKLLAVHFHETDTNAPKQPARKKPHRIQCRVTDAVYALLQRRLEQIGLNTQDYIEALILRDLEVAKIHEQVP